MESPADSRRQPPKDQAEGPPPRQGPLGRLLPHRRPARQILRRQRTVPARRAIRGPPLGTTAGHLRQAPRAWPRQLRVGAAGTSPRTGAGQPQSCPRGRRPARWGTPRIRGEHRAYGVPSFEVAVDKVLAIHGAAWKAGGKNAQRWKATLHEYAYPRLGGKNIDRVTTADVMAVLLPIWTRKHATARQVRQRISAVMKWAIALR